ncbi:MAG: hypothetical protein AAB505_02290 [Patescibacteria group bacterium]
MKTVWLSLLIAGVLVGGALALTNDDDQAGAANNVTIVDGKQIIEIRARGGYQPRRSVAAAGLPTIIRFNTNGTLDCSSAVRIPSLGISQLLPRTGSTDIDVGRPQVATLQGTCGMGMYPFEIEFRG